MRASYEVLLLGSLRAPFKRYRESFLSYSLSPKDLLARNMLFISEAAMQCVSTFSAHETFATQLRIEGDQPCLSEDGLLTQSSSC